MRGRLIHKADFESLMAAPTWSRSAHFALHHLARGPGGVAAEPAPPQAEELSTGRSVARSVSVDKWRGAIWVGAVVPKRHARRAVMRNLFKRHIHLAFQRHEAALPSGLWLARLRRPFEKTEFVSASSARLREAVRSELERLLCSGGPCR